jgi:hypothetical protein
VIRQALMIEGRALMPAFSMAMTKGEDAASDVTLSRSELEGQPASVSLSERPLGPTSSRM